MNYKTPLFLSLAASAVAIGLYFSGFPVLSQSLLAFSFLTSILAFKLRGGLESGAAHALSSWFMAFICFRASSPLVSAALFLLPMQNAGMEIFFPRQMYHVYTPKIVILLLVVASYVAGNLLYPTSWQAWAFPGLDILFAGLLTLMIVSDVKGLEVAAGKGYMEVGSPCPEFDLPDERGKMVSKNDFAGKYLLMIFVRGDWCPGCHIMLRTYQRNRDKFAERGVNLLSIGPDPLGVNKEMVEKLGLNYHILSDEKQMLARQFCVELQHKGGGVPENYEFVPLPASFLIDKGGIVRYTSRADKAGEILNPAQVFEVLDSLA